MYVDTNGCIVIAENNSGNPDDWQNYIAYNYWARFITAGSTDNPAPRIVFTTAGSVNLNPDPGQCTKPDEAKQIAQCFRGVNQYYKDAWLRILVRLPAEHYYSTDTQTLNVEEAVPYVGISGIEKGPDNHYGGWVVWNFGADPLVRSYDRGSPSKPSDQIPIWVHMGIKGDLFQIVRVGYSLTVAGRVVPRPPQPGPE